MNVVLYTKTNCLLCKMIKRKYQEWQVLFEERNIDDNYAFKDDILDMGFKSAPVTVYGDGEDERFAGLNMPRVDEVRQRFGIPPLV